VYGDNRFGLRRDRLLDLGRIDAPVIPADIYEHGDGIDIQHRAGRCLPCQTGDNYLIAQSDAARLKSKLQSNGSISRRYGIFGADEFRKGLVEFQLLRAIIRPDPAS